MCKNVGEKGSTQLPNHIQDECSSTTLRMGSDGGLDRILQGTPPIKANWELELFWINPTYKELKSEVVGKCGYQQNHSLLLFCAISCILRRIWMEVHHGIRNARLQGDYSDYALTEPCPLRSTDDPSGYGC
ncbi:unnamed protein product [Microthlaspi erraticum]|uniref:Uncharacterized protein n=1 Tax=Microthlaspi erraticum TaxID=1685480 RepID=A0A6D2K6Y2_9BRAS|nr:unnamed protein product [Microthlaspi erraticum]